MTSSVRCSLTPMYVSVTSVSTTSCRLEINAPIIRLAAQVLQEAYGCLLLFCVPLSCQS